MRQDYTHMIILLDGSGSMSGCWSDTIGSLESLFKEQKEKDGKLTVSLAIFDSRYQKIYNLTDVKNIETLSNLKNLNGITALYDSFCRLVDEEGLNLARLNEQDRPSKVLFVTLTDGYENASREFTLANTKDKLTHQNTKYNWDFMFLGADFDARGVTSSLGLSSDYACNYSKFDTVKTGGVLNNLVSNYRTSNSRLLTKDVQDMQAEVSST